jgi:hypothetical protein
MPGISVRGPLIIGQSEVEGQLRARLAELAREVAWRTELVAAEEGKSDIKVTLRSQAGEQVGEYVVLADWLVGCDGSQSKTRSTAPWLPKFSSEPPFGQQRVDTAHSRLSVSPGDASPGGPAKISGQGVSAQGQLQGRPAGIPDRTAFTAGRRCAFRSESRRPRPRRALPSAAGGRTDDAGCTEFQGLGSAAVRRRPQGPLCLRGGSTFPLGQ